MGNLAHGQLEVGVRSISVYRNISFLDVTVTKAYKIMNFLQFILDITMLSFFKILFWNFFDVTTLRFYWFSYFSQNKNLFLLDNVQQLTTFSTTTNGFFFQPLAIERAQKFFLRKTILHSFLRIHTNHYSYMRWINHKKTNWKQNPNFRDDFFLVYIKQ